MNWLIYIGGLCLLMPFSILGQEKFNKIIKTYCPSRSIGDELLGEFVMVAGVITTWIWICWRFIR